MQLYACNLSPGGDSFLPHSLQGAPGQYGQFKPPPSIVGGLEISRPDFRFSIFPNSGIRGVRPQQLDGLAHQL